MSTNSDVYIKVLRWHPVTPLAIPHSLMTEDEYRGYRLPKDSVVFGNAWSAVVINLNFTID